MLDDDKAMVLNKHPLAKLEVHRTFGGIRSFCISVPGFDYVVNDRLVRSYSVWRISEEAAWREAATRAKQEDEQAMT